MPKVHYLSPLYRTILLVFYHVNVRKTQKLANFQTFFFYMDEHYTLHILRLNKPT